MADLELLSRFTVWAGIFDGKPIIRDIVVEHVLGMLTAADRAEIILDECPS